MIIGHLPAGYILSKYGYARFGKYISDYRKFMFWSISGSVAPDFDMLYFHLIDNHKTHHHKYFTHYPVVWAGLIFAAFLLFASRSNRKSGIYALAFSISGFIHLILDTIAGDVWWLAPFVDKSFALITVPALYKPWWLSFIFHYSFMIELGIVLWAICIWYNGLVAKNTKMSGN